jgi:hypothetical protein
MEPMAQPELELALTTTHACPVAAQLSPGSKDPENTISIAQWILSLDPADDPADKKGCLVKNCQQKINEEVAGCVYCKAHEFEPLGPVPFDEVQQALIDLRDSTNFDGWMYYNEEGHVKEGWDRLETYAAIEQLSQCYGIEVEDGKLVAMNLGDCHLSGRLPASIAKLDTLEWLNLATNELEGSLPAHIGSPSCLPKLKMLSVFDNPQLGGIIDTKWLIEGEVCEVSGCHWSMQLPYITGASLSSVDISDVFSYAPHEAVGKERVQCAVTEITKQHVDYARFTAHLSAPLAAQTNLWGLWQYTWLTALRKIKSGYLFVFVNEKHIQGPSVTELVFTNDESGQTMCMPQEGHITSTNDVEGRSFKSKFLTRKYVDGERDEKEGIFKTGEQLCQEHNFDPSYGFDDEGWDFPQGTKGLNILDFERRHLEAVSKKYKLPTVFISFRSFYPFGVQVARPNWFPYSGVEAPLGKVRFSKMHNRLWIHNSQQTGCCAVA